MKNQPLLNSNSDYIELDDIIQIKNSNNETKLNIKGKDINILLNISSNNILKNIFLYIKYTTSLKLIKNNKSLQIKLGINIENYKDYSDFEYIVKREEITIKEKDFKPDDYNVYFQIFIVYILPSSIYIMYMCLYSLIFLMLELQTINIFIFMTNICLIGLFIISFAFYLIEAFNAYHLKISKFHLNLIFNSIWIYVLYEILILLRVFILLKNTKAVDERDAVLYLDIIFLILNFIWIIIRRYHYFFFKDNFKIVEKKDNYYLIKYKNIYIQEYSLPNDFMNINKIKYLKNISKNLEHLQSKEDLNIISSINNLRINNNLNELKVLTNLPKCIIDNPSEFILYNYENIFRLSDNKYILKYKLGSFNFDFQNKNKEIMNILLSKNINGINIIIQGKIQYILLDFFYEFDNEEELNIHDKNIKI